MRSARTQDERDATTVEIVYAAATGILLAAAGFAATISPVLADAAHGTARQGWFTAAVVLATGIFCGRVALTLRRFEQGNRSRDLDTAAGQPSQPGRTRPDS
ncbi:hypothetical protein GA0115240_13226 [Streptomyces sp. DvalAA-14]|uniref:DUF6332 family protein n=1 Tax=unclassified Streptomyces TaxID=2593676 RepID=UPI00081B1443|nr:MULTISPECIES: DUF6332 family protein [unclassified Streptomyces]MYS21512.1 hypothetical protein [Streptomyces sp. SID4948]SCD94628.1 hypothetical protein GA0115240_13226 [Streptomyces sp. DvalAA-14]